MTSLLKPSTLLPKGLQVQRINNLTLFKFTDELGERLQTLLDKQKDGTLTAEEGLELEAIGELDEIFSYVNAVMLAEASIYTECHWPGMTNVIGAALEISSTSVNVIDEAMDGR
jgi:hypothetical protein